MKGFVYFLLCIVTVFAFELSDSIGSKIKHEDGSTWIHPHSAGTQLMVDRLRTHMRLTDNPFDFTVDWDPQVWPKDALDLFIRDCKITNATISWEIGITKYKVFGTRDVIDSIGGNPLTTRCRVVLDKDAWFKDPEPFMWGLPSFSFDIPETEFNYEKLDFEGAGFTLTYKDSVIFVTRNNPKAGAQPVLESVGGKVEGNETPAQTAFAELVEEIGADILDSDWEIRANTSTTLQPFSKKWIWDFVLELTDIEYGKLVAADKALDDWAIEDKKSFKHITGREEEARKAIGEICAVDKKDLIALVTKFSKIEPSTNRMKDAQAFGIEHQLTVRRLTTGKEYTRALRGVKLVILEQHLDQIK